NAFDLAIAVVIGNAFSKIVTSLVNDILMPFISLLLQSQDFSGLTLTIGKVNINYGIFIQNIVDFLIIAFCIFIFIKLMNKLFKKKEEDKKEEAEVKKEESVILLEEIRDLIKKSNKK
ncbi:MAG: large conductance mechanosensitive channel protein MscL, partial [Bacilli bacterium]